MDKIATTSFPVHDLIASRWSPRAFADRRVARETIGSLLEAARWAPSCFNAQPWSYLVATSDDEASFDRLAACLVEGNAWAKRAPVLMLSVARSNFEHNDKPNRHAFHDVGLATENLVLEAQALGLCVHQMAGFDRERARQDLRIPEGFEPVAMLAVGYPGDPDSLADDLRAREVAPRERRELSAFVFGAEWGRASELVAEQ